jgi:2-phospho-L-lactate guanylyltransferase (CobY/MobA/RfbA family)
VISNAPVKIIAKSHKGEELIVVNSADMQAIRDEDLLQLQKSESHQEVIIQD